MRRKPRTDDPVPRELRSFDPRVWGGTLEAAFAAWRAERLEYSLAHRDLLTPLEAILGARDEAVRVGLRPARAARKRL